MRLTIIVLALLSSVVSGQSLPQIGAVNNIEMIGAGQVKWQSENHLLDVVINERGVSAVKTAKIVESKITLINQFADKYSKSIKIDSVSPLVLKVLSPALNNTIDDVDVLARLPNKRLAKINTKLNNNQSMNIVNIGTAVISASQNIVLSVTDTKSYQHLIDQLMKIGVHDLQSVVLSQQTFRILYQRALNDAVVDAKNKADKIAEQLNISLAEVIAVQEINVENNIFTSILDKKSNIVEKLPYNEHDGNQRMINAQVKVIFAIKPQ
jgi:uncharacterized protein YggE